jgi:hypothetical protein
MPKLSEATAAERWNVPGMVEGIAAEVDGYSVERERWDVDIDFTFTFKGLPNDLCPAHHVGYVVKGTLILTMADGTEEVFEGGDAVVIEPGHTAAVTAGSEFVTFTPVEEARAMAPIVEANMMKFAQEQGIDLEG